MNELQDNCKCHQMKIFLLQKQVLVKRDHKKYCFHWNLHHTNSWWWKNAKLSVSTIFTSRSTYRRDFNFYDWDEVSPLPVCFQLHPAAPYNRKTMVYSTTGQAQSLYMYLNLTSTLAVEYEVCNPTIADLTTVTVEWVLCSVSGPHYGCQRLSGFPFNRRMVSKRIIIIMYG